MMSVVKSSMLALVELADADGLADTHGSDSFNALHGAYVERLRGWARSGDTWKLIGNNRFCVVLNGVDSRAELELATAKLAGR